MPDPLFYRAAADTTRTEYERRQAEQAWQRADVERAAGRRAAARTWLERAFRFTPSDQNLAFAVATARLGDGDFQGTLDLLNRIAARHAVREVYVGQAAAALALGKPGDAALHLARALSGFTIDAAAAGLAERWAALTGLAWCGVTHEGVLRIGGAAAPTVRLDGKILVVRPAPAPGGQSVTLPPAWRRAAVLSVEAGGAVVLGSPIDMRMIRRLEGCVQRTASGAEGWAWHPNAPEIDPVLHIDIEGKRRRIVATDRTVDVRGTTPLTRPRGFKIAFAAHYAARITGGGGRDLLGSPLAAPQLPAPAPAPCAGGGVTVVIPVYGGLNTTLDCVRSVIATIGAADRVVVVNDASPEPALVSALQTQADAGQIRLVASCGEDPSRNLGFPAAANAGLRAGGGTDVVLLNSDTLVFPGWLAALRAAVHARPDIGTATPLSNDATIFTYPDPTAPAPMPGPAEGAVLARQAASANAGIIVDVPTGHGFCLFIRADCLAATGLLREDIFAQGYGEENDFCERARALGWRHVAVPGVYVAHRGGVSFGAARDHLVHRNAVLLDALHPAYHGRVADFIARDGLAAARRRLDAVRWQASHAASLAAGAVLLISHGGVGGTRRVVRERAAAIAAGGLAAVQLAAD